MAKRFPPAAATGIVSIVAALGLVGAVVASVGGATSAAATSPGGTTSTTTTTSTTSSGATPQVSATAAHPYSASLTYLETNHGYLRGATTLGMQGHGQFSFQLSPLTAAQVSLLSRLTGVPLRRLSWGGIYTVARQIADDGTITGTAVAAFKARSLGSVCISYIESPGIWVPGADFVPMSGSLTIIGGTKRAAGWRLHVSFAQTTLAGWYLKRIQANGFGRVATGAARSMTSTCRRVASIKH